MSDPQKLGVTLPKDQSGNAIQLTSPESAVARTLSSSISSATTINLNSLTALIEVTARNQGIYLRYQVGVSNSNFDEYILPDSTRHYVIPQGCTAISVIEEAATATVIVIEKSS